MSLQFCAQNQRFCLTYNIVGLNRILCVCVCANGLDVVSRCQVLDQEEAKVSV